MQPKRHSRVNVLEDARGCTVLGYEYCISKDIIFIKTSVQVLLYSVAQVLFAKMELSL